MHFGGYFYMARVTVEDCLKKVENRFVLVHMSNKRTRQLLKGAAQMVKAPDNREVVVSLREIADGKVYLTEQAQQRLLEGGYVDFRKS